ncbi:MAG: nickel pincer cofactor biosynthesis protein LarC [Thermoguttaceae bacterium]
MKIAYIDCLSGISGDMTLGALIDLGVSIDLLNRLFSFILPEVHIEKETVRRAGFRAIRAHVHIRGENGDSHSHDGHSHDGHTHGGHAHGGQTHDVHSHGGHAHDGHAHPKNEHHEHRNLSAILSLFEKGVAAGVLSQNCSETASKIFRILAEAEALVHGIDVDDVHFHEVGAADSIADILGVVVGLDCLNVDAVYASAVPTGCGTIQISHGTCSIPAPATAELLKTIPIAASNVPFELTTPTGAVILKYYVQKFGPAPAMKCQQIGIGAGKRDLPEQANILRIFLGETAGKQVAENSSQQKSSFDSSSEHSDSGLSCSGVSDAESTVFVIETNIDDMSGELVGHCIERLWSLRPLDVWTTPIQMKKQRPGIVLSILCPAELIEAVETLLFEETTTIGVRRYPVARTILPRKLIQITTKWGPLDAKTTTLPDGREKTVPEFESAKRLAEKHGVSVREILEVYTN